LVGCTQRESSASVFSEEHIRNIDSICSKAIDNHKYVDVVFKGIGLIGNQIFIQGMPIDNGWETLRTDVTQELESHGERPISYPDKSPIHMNIIRITDASSEKLQILRELIDQLRDIEIGTVRFVTIELVITDFVVSKKNMTALKEYSLENID
jgi:2'-5' RNA ligase